MADRKNTKNIESEKKTLSRRTILAGAAAGLAASVSGQADAQQRRTNQPVRQTRRPATQPRNSATVAELQVDSTLRVDALPSRISQLLQQDMGLRGEEYAHSMDIIQSVVSRVGEDFSGVMVFDFNDPAGTGLDMRSLANQGTPCGTFSCGTHGCRSHDCGSDGCDVQTCRTNDCESDACNSKDCSDSFTSFTGTSIMDSATAIQEVWRDLADLHAQHQAMNSVMIEIHHDQAARINTVDILQ